MAISLWRMTFTTATAAVLAAGPALAQSPLLQLAPGSGADDSRPGRPGVVLKPRNGTLGVQCTCKCGDRYFVVDTLGTKACEDLTKEKRECVVDGGKHTLEDCRHRLAPTGRITLDTAIGEVLGEVVGGGGAPGIAFAETTVNCKSGKSFTIGTGTGAGACVVNTTSGQVTGGTCSDGQNEATADCKSNSGDGACGNTQGSGKCNIAK